MRLINADILKSAITAMDYLSETNLNFICKAIDNAPTVDLKDIYQEGHYDGHLEGYTKAINEERPQGNISDDYLIGYFEGCKDTRAKIDKQLERLQGEWIVQPHSMIMKCSLCSHEENAKDVGTINPDKHFCSFCGAEMMKGGIEE